MKEIITLIILLIATISSAQNILYVSGQSGLIVRDQPDILSNRIGKFEYSTAVKLLERSDKIIYIRDGQDSIRGRWYEVMSSDKNNSTLSGYVFSGYLGNEKPPAQVTKKIKIKDFELTISASNQNEYDQLESTKNNESNWLNETECLKKGLLTIQSPMEFTVKSKVGKPIQIHSPYEDDEQFYGYTFVKYNQESLYYVVYENWLEAGHHILISAENGKIIPIFGESVAVSMNKNIIANYQLDIGAGWTPNGIQILALNNGHIQELFGFDPNEHLEENWGPGEIKWVNENSILVKGVMPNVDGGYIVFYKKIEFKNVK